MNYFVAQNLGAKLTGIEKSQINRLYLFEKASLSAKCIYTNFNTRLHENAETFGIQGKCFSLYDYFQQTTDYKTTKRFGWIHYWMNQCNYSLKYVPNSYDIRVYDEHNLFIMYVHFNDDTYTNIVYINYFDKNGKKIKREFYDSRGFLSKINLLDTKQRVQSELFLDSNGVVKIEKFYQLLEDNTNTLTKIILNNYQERTHFFNTELEFQRFFFNEYFTEDDIIFSDKNQHLAEPLSTTSKKLTICAVFHSTHTVDSKNVLNSNIKKAYHYVLRHPQKFARIIVSTEMQKQDLLTRFPNQLPQINVIPVGFTKERSIDLKMKQKNKIISIARYSPEKQLLHQIEVMERLIIDFPEAKLHFFGYGSQEKDMRKMIEEKKLQNNVIIEGFAVDLFSEYQSASLSLLTSRIEGFSLALLEAQEFGVPAISYDVRYGPNEILQDGVNGFLVETDNKEMLYSKIHVFLSDLKLQKQMMVASQKRAADFNQQELIVKWRTFVSEFLSLNK